MQELKRQFILNLLTENKEQSEKIKTGLSSKPNPEQFEHLWQTHNHLLHQETLLKNRLAELTNSETLQTHIEQPSK